MEDPLGLRGIACVAHVHSTYSDGTATIPELAEAAAEAGVECVMLTDHDTLEAQRRGEEGWHGDVLILVGHEVSPKGGHLLVFGVDEEIGHAGRSEREILEAVRTAGGVAIAAHPFSEGSRMSKKIAPPHGWGLLDDEASPGVELWSLETDSAEAWRSPREAVAFLRDPMRFLDGPPPRHLAIWDELCRRRRVPAIGGLDAHQKGIRVRGRVRTPMPNARYFGLLQTHVLLDAEPSRDLDRDAAAILGALAEGRCYLSFEALAPGAGFRFWAEGADGTVPMGGQAAPGRWALRATLPRTAAIRIVRDGTVVHEREGGELECVVETEGAYRLEARLPGDERGRLWIVSNPIYLRAG